MKSHYQTPIKALQIVVKLANKLGSDMQCIGRDWEFEHPVAR